MKEFLSSILIIGLLFIGLFGFAALGHSMNHGQADCLTSTIFNAPCPNNVISLAQHHISAVQKLFNVPVEMFLVLLVSLVAVSILRFAYLYQFLILRSQFLSQRLQASREKIDHLKHRLISWLSLLEHSPSF